MDMTDSTGNCLFTQKNSVTQTIKPILYLAFVFRICAFALPIIYRALTNKDAASMQSPLFCNLYCCPSPNPKI